MQINVESLVSNRRYEFKGTLAFPTFLFCLMSWWSTSGTQLWLVLATAIAILMVFSKIFNLFFVTGEQYMKVGRVAVLSCVSIVGQIVIWGISVYLISKLIHVRY